MKFRCTLALTVVLTLAAGASAQDAKKEQALLQGKWQAIKLDIGGNEVAADETAKFTITFTGDQLLVTGADGMQKKHTFTLDPSKKPRAIDVTPESGEAAGKKLAGIYVLEGETLRMCLGLPGIDRPDAFATGETRVLIALKRVK